MKLPYDKACAAHCVSNLMQALPFRNERVRKILCEWLTDEGSWLNVSFVFEREAEGIFVHGPEADEERWRRTPRRRRHHDLQEDASPETCREAAHFLARRFESPPSPPGHGLFANMNLLVRRMNFSRLHERLLQIALLMQVEDSFEKLCDEIFGKGLFSIEWVLSALMGEKRGRSREIKTALADLQRAGFFEDRSFRRMDFSDYLSVEESFLSALLPPNKGWADICRSLFGMPVRPLLRWDDYNHMRADRDLVCDILKAACRERTKGINILLYGPSGTGKTELAKTMAARLRKTLYSVGETDEDGDDPRGDRRLKFLKMADVILGNRRDTLLLFDEMEDLLPPIRLFSSRDSSKVFLNRCFENNRLPVIWTSNDIDAFDPALLRRLTLAVEVKVPPSDTRARVWRRILRRNGINMPPKEIETLAGDLDVAPGIVENAAKVARLSGRSGKESLTLVSGSLKKAMAGGREENKPPAQAGRDYVPALENTDVDLARLTEQVAGGGKTGFSLLLYGPSGTGKSAYARYLARRMKKDVVFKRASDLLDKYVGNSEKNIAGAFREAREKKALLIFDEADSLLRERRQARQSWEVSQVNEMLTWMESHPEPFVCTTNLKEELDAASMRRFTFKVAYDYLTDDQCRAAFQHFFGHAAEKGAPFSRTLTPGDFAVVTRKAEVLDCLKDTAVLMEMLAAECRAKPDAARRNPIGFTAPGAAS